MPIPKVDLLTILASETCPICARLKHRFNWACGACYNPHLKTDEHHHLSDTCDAHMEAAEAFILMARRHGQKPESD